MLKIYLIYYKNNYILKDIDQQPEGHENMFKIYQTLMKSYNYIYYIYLIYLKRFIMYW